MNFNLDLSAQNLVPNGDFEATNKCHEYREFCAPKAWRSTNKKLAKYNINRKHPDSLKIGKFVSNSFVTLLLSDNARKFDRKFIQTELLCPLVKDQVYEFSLRIMTNEFVPNSIGVVFSDSLLCQSKNDYLENIDEDILIAIPDSLMIKNTWTNLRANYVANGNEKVIIIGNFASDSMEYAKAVFDPNFIEIKKKKRKKKDEIKPNIAVKLSIDDLSLITESPIDNCNLLQKKDRIYKDSTRHSFEAIQLINARIRQDKN